MNAHHAWLHGELPPLVGEGVISAAQADALRARYPAPGAEPRARNFLQAVGVLFVGVGAIVLCADRWDELSVGVRTALALVPAAAALIYDRYARGTDGRTERGTAFQESAAIGLVLGTAASFTLIESTWHVVIAPTTRAIAAALATLGVGWARSVTAPLVAYPALVLVVLGTETSANHGALTLGCAALLALALPAARSGTRSPGAWRWLACAFAIVSFVLTVKAALDASRSPVGAVGAWVLGAHAVDRGLLPRGGVGSSVLSALTRSAMLPLVLALGFTTTWGSRATESLLAAALSGSPAAGGYLLTWLAPIGLSAFALARRRALDPAISGTGTLTLVGLTAIDAGISATIPSIAALCLSVASGVSFIHRGAKAGSASDMNFGLALVLGLVLIEVAATQTSVLVKGLAFICAGAVVLAVNRAISRRSGR